MPPKTKPDPRTTAREVSPTGEVLHEVLVISGVEVLPPMKEVGDRFEGVYLGSVVKQSTKFTKRGEPPAEVRLHLMQMPEGIFGMWGSAAIDEGLGSPTIRLGRFTRVEVSGFKDTGKGNPMRLIKLHQGRVEHADAPVIRDAKAEADAIYAMLGLDGMGVEIDKSTGEVARVFEDLNDGDETTAS